MTNVWIITLVQIMYWSSPPEGRSDTACSQARLYGTAAGVGAGFPSPVQFLDWMGAGEIGKMSASIFL
jgi:hypothetical protein